MNTRTPESKIIRHFARKIPTWVYAIVLFGGGLCLKGIPWALAPQIGDALMIAGILAITVDPFLKNKLINEFAEGVFEHMVGFSQEPEIRAEIRKLAFETHFYQKRYDLRCSIDINGDGWVSVKATKQLQIINQTLDNHEFRPGWRFTEADKPRDCRVTYLIDDQTPEVHTQQFEMKGGYADGYTKSVKIAPQNKGKNFSFRAECTFDAPLDYYHPMYFEYPTIGIDITVEAPEGWTVWVGGQPNDSNKIVFHSAALYMPKDKVEIHWRTGHSQASSSAIAHG